MADEKPMLKDPLTGLLNHTSILQKLEVELAMADARELPLAVVMIDIDRFKMINDTYGHTVGDLVLHSLSTFFEDNLRQTDSVGRYGGEEFLIILPDADHDAALSIVKNLQEKFSLLDQQANGIPFKVSFCCGMALYPSLKNLSVLVAAADQALAKAKQAGSNQLNCYQTQPNSPSNFSV